jgi:hypothetical protein
MSGLNLLWYLVKFDLEEFRYFINQTRKLNPHLSTLTDEQLITQMFARRESRNDFQISEMELKSMISNEGMSISIKSNINAPVSQDLPETNGTGEELKEGKE